MHKVPRCGVGGDDCFVTRIKKENEEHFPINEALPYDEDTRGAEEERQASLEARMDLERPSPR